MTRALFSTLLLLAGCGGQAELYDFDTRTEVPEVSESAPGEVVNGSPIELHPLTPVAGTVTGTVANIRATLTPVVVQPPQPETPAVTTERQLGTTGAPYGFVEYLPKGYSPTGAAFPLMIMLHGLGECGNGTSDLTRVRWNGPNAEIDSKGKSFPMIILSPQSPGWWDGNTLNTFLTWAMQQYRVDAKRVYLTGLSMGGGGTFDFAAGFANKLAAIAPICAASGGGNDTNGATLVNAGVAVWAAHALDDPTVNISSTRDWMTAIGHAQGQPTSENVFKDYPTGTTEWKTGRYDAATKAWIWVTGQDYRDSNGAPYAEKQLVTIYPSGGHNIWGNLYGDPKLYEWLLRQARP